MAIFTSPPNEKALGGKLILLPPQTRILWGESWNGEFYFPPTMGGTEIALSPLGQKLGGAIYFYCPPIFWGESGRYGQEPDW